jgi:hypothetical protein
VTMFVRDGMEADIPALASVACSSFTSNWWSCLSIWAASKHQGTRGTETLGGRTWSTRAVDDGDGPYKRQMVVDKVQSSEMCDTLLDELVNKVHIVVKRVLSLSAMFLLGQTTALTTRFSNEYQA